MTDYYELGVQLRSLLRGLLLGEPGQAPRPPDRPASPSAADWGPRIQIAGLDDIYGPQQVVEYTPPRGGIDNLSLSSADTFIVPGMGEFTVNFDGYFRIARADPTSADWAAANVYVNLVDMNLVGTHPSLGRITVRPNRDIVSPGQTFAPGAATAPAACRIAAGVEFESEALGTTLFNKEPILLMNDAISAIPPVEDPNGSAFLYRLPLYDRARPDGAPAAYLTRLKYTVGNYVTQAEAAAFRVR